MEVPIDSIETGIRSAAICLADITTDNPNVWYELGFAFASGRPVVMVCSSERTGNKFPFDIQHRSIITYSVEAPEDFRKLQGDLTGRMKALLEKGETLRQMAETEQVAPLAGLSQPELTVLAAASALPVEQSISLYAVKRDAEGVGLTNMGFSLGLRRLRAKGFIELAKDTEYTGEIFDIVKVTEAAWDWIEVNESLFVLRRHDAGNSADDDIPF